MAGKELFKATRPYAIVGAAYAVIGGLLSLLGWVFAVPRLIDWHGMGITIKANPSICILLAGSALLIAIFSPDRRILIRGLGVATFLIAFLTLFQRIAGIDLGIDTLLFYEPPGAPATASPGRMGVPASISLSMLGVAIVCSTYTADARRVASTLGYLVLAISSLSIIGYLYQANQLFEIAQITGIALQTATMLAALGLAMVAIVPEWGIAAVLSREDAGGVAFRRVLFPIILLLLVLGALKLAGERAGLFDPGFGSAARTIVEIWIIVILLWWMSNGISRAHAETRLISKLPAENPNPEIRLSRGGEILYRNDASLEITEGWGKPERHTVAEDIRRWAKSSFESGQRETHEFASGGKTYSGTFVPIEDSEVVNIYAADITERRSSEKLVELRARDLAVLYTLTDSLNRSQNIADLYEDALNAITEALQCDRASILLFDQNDEMSFVASRGLSEPYQKAVNGHSPWPKGTTKAKPFGIENISASGESDELKEVVLREGIVSLGFIPLIYSDELIGKFMVYYDRPHKYTETELDVAMTIGRQIAFGVQRKRTEESLRENEERLRLATHTGKVGVWDWDIKAGFVSWTPTVYTMHGVKEGDFDGTVESFSALIHPEDREDIGRRIEQALRGENPYEVEFRVPKSDGTTNWLFTNAIILRDAGGQPTRMIGATVDITERKLTEIALLRAANIVNSSRDAIVGKDLNGIVTSWNRAAENLFGYSAEEMIGSSITKLIPLDRIDEEAVILGRISRGENIEHYETIRRRKNGTLVNISITVSPLTDARGQVIGASKIARDITEKLRAEAALRDREIMSRLVQAQEAERHRIARDLHDHLGQQLTALRLKLESMRAKCSGDAALFREMEETQAYALQIDMDINYLAWELRPTELDQLGLVNALGSFVREWSKTYGIAAEFHVSTNADVRLDPEQETNLYRIVQEGLNNILKHANASNVNVLFEQKADRVLLIIEDDGNGFDPDRVPSATTSKGLGLIGMRERTALMGGTLEVESRPGEGTTVYARIPLARPNSV